MISRDLLAVAVLPKLPDNVLNDALDEFVKLGHTGGLYPQTATIFLNATSATRNRVVALLKSAKAVWRKIFVRVLHDKSVDVGVTDNHSRGDDGGHSVDWDYETTR
jgi:hypothetical protein